MEKLNVELGVKTFALPGGGALRFNPSDPNLYSRFYQAEERLASLEKELAEENCQIPGVLLMAAADRKLKELFSWLLGGDNDVDKALGGVSLLALCTNGKTVAANLLSALEEVVEQGARQLAQSKAERL